jgi:hypothetical protein
MRRLSPGSNCAVLAAAVGCAVALADAHLTTG